VLAHQVANTASCLHRQTAQSSKDSVLISFLVMLISAFRKNLYGLKNAGEDACSPALVFFRRTFKTGISSALNSQRFSGDAASPEMCSLPF
jgi:hypothetical protein